MTTSGADPLTPARPLPDRSLLRIALALDAVVTGVNGAAYLAGATLFDDLLGLDQALLRGVGAFLLAYGLAVGLLAIRPVIPRRFAWAVVAVNAVWAVGSLLVAGLGWGSPTTAGPVWIVLQAMVVGGFALLQRVGLRVGGRA